MNDSHEIFMNRCLELARMGLGNTSPNPMVGSVIVHKEKIIGEGYHRLYGLSHAEVNAIESVKDKSLLKEATLYVNLEPCSHYGKTPPCAELIIKYQIPRVVVGSIDPNPLVAGKGIERLKKEGCDVITGVLDKDCEELNKRFFTYHREKRPYIILKWAESADGFIDKLRSIEEKPEWITNQASRILVHKWRSEEQAIMVATNTALMDNPRLNVRQWKGKDPVRILIDKHLRLPRHLKLLDGRIKTIVYTLQHPETEIDNVEFVQIPMDVDELTFMTSHLHRNKIQSVIVEGGAKFISFLIERNLWDEARVFKGNALFLKGVHAPKLQSKAMLETFIDGVSLKYYDNIH